jgi:hypothetical protein
VTLTWQEAGSRFQLARPAENITEALLVALDRVGELARIAAEEVRLQQRRAEILRQEPE